MEIIHRLDDLSANFNFTDLDVTTVSEIYFILLGPTGYVQKQMSMNGTDPLFPNDDITITDANNVEVRIKREETASLSYGRYTFLVRTAYNNADFTNSVEWRSDSFPTFMVVQPTERTYTGEDVEVSFPIGGDGGAVDSVNGYVGVVVLTTDDIDDSSSTNKFTTQAQLDEIAANTLKNSYPSADATKLSGIEDGATADQTGAEIKSLYEAEADTNAYTDAEKTKLAGIEEAATADQTGTEIVSAIDSELGSSGWQSAGDTPLESEPAAIQITTSVDWSALYDQIVAIANNWGGQTVTIEPAAGTYTLGAYVFSLLKPFNGRLRFAPATLLETASSSQTVIFQLDGAGYFNFGNPFIDIEFHSIKIEYTSAGSTGMRSEGNFKTQYCSWDFTNISKESYSALLYDCIGYSYEDTFIGNGSYVTSVFKSEGAARVKIVNPHYVTTPMNYGLNGEGEVSITGDTIGDLAITTPNFNGAIDLNALSEADLSEIPLVSINSASQTSSSITVNAQTTHVGTLKVVAYYDTDSPTTLEILAGTGARDSAESVVAANTATDLVMNSTIIDNQNYVYYVWSEGLNPSVNVKSGTITTDLAIVQLTSPTLNSVTVTSATSLTANWTDNNTSPNESSFTVGYQSTTWTDSPANTITGVAADSVSQLIESLTTDQAQFVRVMAIGNGAETSDSAWSNEISATPADLVAPTLQSVTIEDASPTDVVIVFDEPVTGTNLGFTLSGTTETTFSSISGIGTNTITGVLATAAASGETILLNYDSGTGDMTDTATTPNSLASISNFAVTNNVGGASYVTQYQTVYDAMTNKPSAAVATAQNAMVSSLVSGGYWSRMDLFYLFAQESNAAGEALLNWISPGTHDAVEQGAGALVFTSLQGLAGDATNYLNTYNPFTEATNLVQDSATIGIYSRTDSAEAVYDCGNSDGTGQLSLALRYSTEILYSRVNTLTAQQIASQPNSLGLFLATRTGAAAGAVYQNGTLLEATTEASTAIANNELTIFGRSAAPSSTRQYSAFFLMNGVDGTEAAAINTIVETYMDAIGAGVQA